MGFYYLLSSKPVLFSIFKILKTRFLPAGVPACTWDLGFYIYTLDYPCFLEGYAKSLFSERCCALQGTHSRKAMR